MRKRLFSACRLFLPALPRSTLFSKNSAAATRRLVKNPRRLPLSLPLFQTAPSAVWDARPRPSFNHCCRICSHCPCRKTSLLFVSPSVFRCFCLPSQPAFPRPSSKKKPLAAPSSFSPPLPFSFPLFPNFFFLHRPSHTKTALPAPFPSAFLPFSMRAQPKPFSKTNRCSFFVLSVSFRSRRLFPKVFQKKNGQPFPVRRFLLFCSV